MTKVPCPHCGEELTVNPNANDAYLVCPKCHVILRLAKDDDKSSLFDLRRFLPRKKTAVGLACAVALVLIAFAVGFSSGVRQGQANGKQGGVVQTAFGLFFAHNELQINDGAPAKADKSSD